MKCAIKKMVLLPTLIFFKCSVFANGKAPDEEIQKSKVKIQIEKLYATDQGIRAELYQLVDKGYTTQSILDHSNFLKYWKQVDYNNQIKLKEIISVFGWPSISKYGKETDQHAWLIVQHATNNLEFQKKILILLRDQLKTNDTDPRNYAYLLDRINVHTGLPQIYGTQGYCAKRGLWLPRRIKDQQNLDQRRLTVGLGPFRKYEEQVKQLCK